MIDCQGGQITLAGRVIHDDKSDRGMGIGHRADGTGNIQRRCRRQTRAQSRPDRFYQYIRDFGFGNRTGMELPGETRGLLRPTAKWSGSSIGSIAIGQEVAVTPLQLVSMVSTIANGGIYLPPHVLISGQATDAKSPPHRRCRRGRSWQPAPFKAGEDLPNPLPTGAHRVISSMTAAQMRKMMEGVVLFGTGKPAQLNGYSSGGKTGTAQKIDPATHLIRRPCTSPPLRASRPVNNPVIAVAVVMDNPKGASYYGTAVSAPVFAEVAQQVLEYLGVPHDIDVQQPKTTAKNGKKDLPTTEDDSANDQQNVNALFAAVNDLPADDPLRSLRRSLPP